MGTMNGFELGEVTFSYDGCGEAVATINVDCNNIQGLDIISEKESNNKTIYKKEMLKRMGVDRVIVNDRAVIVFLTNGDKGVAVCDEDDYFDPMVGFSVAYAIAVGTKGNKSQFKKNLKKVL